MSTLRNKFCLLILILILTNANASVFSAEKREIPDIKKWFPMGVVTYPHHIKAQAKELGYTDENWWDFMEKCFDDFKAHNMNTIFIGNFWKLEEAGRLIDLCEEKGIRVYLQGCNNWYYRGRSREARIEFLKKTIEPYVKKHMPENTTIWIGAIDEEMTAQSYIVPGLGDAGDLAYGEKMEY